MTYQLTDILNRCSKDDANFLVSMIESPVSFADARGLKELIDAWNGEGTMPLDLNRKLEQEIRYLGSNDFAYATRKALGREPAGVGVDEIIDDLAKLLKIVCPRTNSMEARLEIFAGQVIDREFAKLAPERQRQILEQINFDRHRRDEIINRVVNKKELLLPVILPILGRAAGPEILQGIIVSLIAPFIGREAAKQILIQMAARFPIFGAWLGPLLIAGGAGWAFMNLAGPASRKTIPIILYLGAVCLRNGETGDFAREFIPEGEKNARERAFTGARKSAS